MKKKPQLINKDSLDPVRKRVLQERFSGTDVSRYVQTYASFFQMRCPTKTNTALRARYRGSWGVIKELLTDKLSISFELEMAFYRFDGDTLTGRVDGRIKAVGDRSCPL